MPTPYDDLYRLHWSSSEVISREQLAAYGSYDAAVRALKISLLYLPSQIEMEDTTAKS
jgi:hypothetical protein